MSERDPSRSVSTATASYRFGSNRTSAAWLLWLTCLVVRPVVAADDGGSAEGSYDARVDVALHLVSVVVSDSRGRAVPGLPADAFYLRVDGRDVAIEMFETAARPITLALVFDQSVSMLGARLAAAEEAACSLVSLLAPDDRALVISFDHRIRVQLEMTADHEDLLTAIRSLASGGGTSLYDALELAFRSVSRHQGSRAILLFSDGEEAASRVDVGRLLRKARKSGVRLFPVWVGHGGNEVAPRAVVATRQRLDDVAVALGSSSLSLPSADLADIGQTWLAGLRSGYVLGYDDAGTGTVEVGVRREGLTARAELHWRSRQGEGAVSEGQP